MPEIADLPSGVRDEALEVFNRVSMPSEVPSPYERIKQKHMIQREIDVMALKMLDLKDCIDRLDEVSP